MQRYDSNSNFLFFLKKGFFFSYCISQAIRHMLYLILRPSDFKLWKKFLVRKFIIRNKVLIKNDIDSLRKLITNVFFKRFN